MTMLSPFSASMLKIFSDLSANLDPEIQEDIKQRLILAQAVISVLSTAFPSLFHSIKDLIEDSSSYVPSTKREEYSHHAQSVLSEIKDAFQSLLNQSAKSITEAGGIVDTNLRRTLSDIERAIKKYQLIYPHTPEEFELALRWVGAKGQKEELSLLQQIIANPPFDSEKLQQLARIVESEVADRLRLVDTTPTFHRIFCRPEEI